MTKEEYSQTQEILTAIRIGEPLTEDQYRSQIRNWFFNGDEEKLIQFAGKYKTELNNIYAKLVVNRNAPRDYKAKIAPEFYWRQRLKNLIVDTNNSRLLQEAKNIFEELV